MSGFRENRIKKQRKAAKIAYILVTREQGD